jgi:hypothetical protein
MSRKGNYWDNAHGEFFQDAETGTGNHGRQTERGGGTGFGILLHRGIPQPDTPPFGA